MVWPTPEYSRNRVTRAGEFLVKYKSHEDLSDTEFEDLIDAHLVLANWRACHGYPINTFQATLRNRLRKIDPAALVAQRLKRTPSIVNKLARIKGMNLARMQDIGGLRAVVGTMKQLSILSEEYSKKNLSHEIVSQYDYVQHPKNSGYRSIHIVYRYKARTISPYDGLLLELQLRTRVQHSWATAVETAGTFLEHALKSSEGPSEWLAFFALVSSAFAYLEGTPRVAAYQDLSRIETFEKTLEHAAKLRVRERLQGYSTAVQEIAPSAKRAAFYLVNLNLNDKTVNITSFARDQLISANARYAEEEKNTDVSCNQVVLVSAGSIESLRRAYPNYFLDTHEFLKNLSRVERGIAMEQITSRLKRKKIGDSAK
jgi:hypothetical protein